MNIKKFLLLILALTMFGCQSNPNKPIALAESVDINRFMGDWYVIANIPTFIEKNAYNAMESYALLDDGTIDTVFSFRKDGFDGSLKKYNPKGFIRENTGNAVWGMQFIWPFKADYRIVYLNDEYSQTIIGREKRDYVWIMARAPNIADADYQALLMFLEQQGYDISKIQKVPQQWP